MTDPIVRSIHDHLAPFRRGEAVASEWLMLSLGRVLLKAARRGEDWRRLATDEQVSHIADWIVNSIASGLPWTLRRDAAGRPPKLSKFADVASILREADRTMVVLAQKGAAVSLVEGDEAPYADLGDGNRLVRLLTPAALDREGVAMGHCIGGGAYDDGLADGNLYLSLRDARNRPHATLEVRNGRLLQFQGKGNAVPVRRWIDAIVPFLRTSGWKTKIPAYRLGLAIDVEGAWHPIDELPSGLVVGGYLDLQGTKITELPTGMTICGSLNLRGTSITELPVGLTVGGDLYLYGTSIAELPVGLTVGGCLTFGGSLDLREANITELPASLTVNGSLNLRGTSITELPAGLTVGGYLDLQGTKITELPIGLTVDGYLHLGGPNIAELPSCLTVGQGIDLRGTSITELPDSIDDDTIIFGDEGETTAAGFRQARIQACDP